MAELTPERLDEIEAFEKAANPRSDVLILIYEIRRCWAELAQAQKEIFRLEKISDYLAQAAANGGFENHRSPEYWWSEAERATRVAMAFYGQPTYEEKMARFNEIFPPYQGEGEK